MPNYDFKCPQCGKTLEKIVKYNEIHQQPCPECGTLLERQHTVGTLKFLFNYFADSE